MTNPVKIKKGKYGFTIGNDYWQVQLTEKDMEDVLLFRSPHGIENERGERFVYEWYHNKLGKSSFKGKLAEAIVMADSVNREKLALAFPEYVQAFNDYNRTEGWWSYVEEKFAVNKQEVKYKGE